MGLCPKCQKNYMSPTADNEKMVCPNPSCGYSYDFPERIPSYSELLQKYNKAKERIKELEARLGNIP